MTPERVPPPAEMDDETAALVSLTARADEPARTMAVLAHRPKLLAPFLGWAAALALEGGLTNRHHELLALRTALRCGSEYEWVEHVGFARDVGFTDADLERVQAGPDAGGWSVAEAALLRASDELVDSATIADDTWAALAAKFDPGALVEIVYVVGQYTMLSMVANALGVPTSVT